MAKRDCLLEKLANKLGFVDIDEAEKRLTAIEKSIETKRNRVAMDALSELKVAINRALSIVKIHEESRKILSEAVHCIDTYGKMDIDVYKSLPDTLPAIEAVPPTLRTGEVST
jgi:hypothetical protein